MNVGHWLARAARTHPTRPALAQGKTVLSYAQLAERVARLAAFLEARGLQPGDRLAALQWNSPVLLETMLAAFHGGFCIVPINARATPNEAAEILRDAEPGAVVYDPDYADHVAALGAERPGLAIATAADPQADMLYDDALNQGTPAPPRDLAGDAPAWLFYTSGTTGRPKGATLTHRALTAMTLAYLSDLRRPPPGAGVLHAAPLTHGSGLYALPALAAGATQVLTTSRSYAPDEILLTIRERGLSDIAFLTPTMVKWLVEEAPDGPGTLPTLEHVVYGGAPMYHDDLIAALSAFGPVFSQIYGQAEAPVSIARLSRDDHAAALTGKRDILLSAGRAYTNVEMAVASENDAISADGAGEIVARGDVVMSGYWRNETATAEALRGGWLHTGDIGRVDPNGLLFLLDRSKDVIISGGANIYPREVEEVILEHPQVRQVAVVGAPDDTWGERVVSVLVLHDGAAGSAVERELETLCRSRLAGYKLPRQFDLRDELPTSPYGKVLKRELRAAYWDGRERLI